MELPLGGPALRHYTQSRPRPHRQNLNYRPSRLQETIIETDNEVLELMGRVDEGVEEFFTKRVLPTDTLKKQDEESITVDEVAPASSVPCPPQTKTLRRKLGDFFTLRKRRGLKSEPSQEGRPKKTSIADLIRPLREVTRAEKEKEKDRVKEHDKENEKEKDGESAVEETAVLGTAPLRGEAVPPRRALREGKSQSLILLSGSAAGTTSTRNTTKKQFEGQHSFEQKLHLMLQRIGVSKAQPEEIQEGEMKKAESEGTIIDSKPEPPPTFTKVRTMSASSDTRHQMRPSVSAHESAGKPALFPKPVIKPGPPPTTSGRNTPENELAQIEEAETSTPTKQSPTAAPHTPTATPTAAAITPTVPTISDSVLDSTNCTISPSCTLQPSDADTRTVSVKAATAPTIPTNVTELDSKPSIPEANATTAELHTSTPAEPPVSLSVTSISLSLSVTSNSASVTAPIATTETVSAPSNESPVHTASRDLSQKSTLTESSGILLVGDAAPAAAGYDAAISTTTTASSHSSASTTSISQTPPGSSTATTIASVTEASTIRSVSSVTTATSPHPNSSDTVTTPVSSDPTITSSSTITPSSKLISPVTSIMTPKSTDCTDSDPQPSASSPASAAVPPTSSSETNPTDTTTTTTTGLNRADSTSTTSSATPAAISSPPVTDSGPTDTKNVSTPTTTDNSSAPSHCLSSPESSHKSPGQDNYSHTSAEQRSVEETTEKGTAADEELEMVRKSSTETDESKTVISSGKGRENEREKPAQVKSEVTNEKEKQEECVKPEGDAVKTDVEWTEPASSEKADAGLIKGQKLEETKSVK